MVQMGTVWDRTTAAASTLLGAIMPIAIVLVFLPISVQLSLRPLLEKSVAVEKFGVLAICWAIELLGTLAIIVLSLGATNRTSEALRTALRRWPVVIGVMLALIVVAGLAAVPMWVAMRMSGMDMAAIEAGHATPPSAITPGIALFLLLYMLVYLVVLLWATARLLVIEPVILAERHGLGAIKRAFTLTHGLTWRIVGVILLYGIVASIAALAAETVFGSILRLIAPDDGDIGIATVITAVIVAAISAAFKVLAAIFVAQLYLAVADRIERLAEPS
jgi:hypothetical protein